MKRLLEIEFLKLRSYRPFWSSTITYAILFLVFVLIFGNLSSGLIDWVKSFSSPTDAGADGLDYHPLKFPYVWHSAAYFGKFFKILLGVLVISIIAYEFQSGNLKQGVIHGLTRIELLLGKVILVCTLGLYSSVLIFLTGLILGFWHTEDILLADMYKSSGFFFLSLLNIIVYLSLAVMIAFLTKNTASAIILLILIWFPGDWIIGLMIPESIEWLENFRPMEVIDELIPLKEFVAKNSLLDMATNTYYKSREVELWQLCMACFAYLAIYWLIIYRCIRRDM